MNESVIQLDQLKIGDKAKVVSIAPESRVRRRLMDMGIVRGTDVFMEGKAPMGDPIEIGVRGYVLTLRKNEAKDVLVERF
ncbi:FeoA family protein [Clostridium rectalis]|uniref:FeoA family protein n=1 Tax=Clostridium rectalis TaxID=2040295 RepID=UPI000F62CE40|nr:ferrous iron transport protein A [Clostridium rectalis]